MIDIKIQEVIEYFYGNEIRWRDTPLKGVHYYYAENGQYVFRFPHGYHYAYIFIGSTSSQDATQLFAETTRKHLIGEDIGESFDTVCDFIKKYVE